MASYSLLVCLALLAALSPCLVLGDGWQYGRATYYGNEPWYWDIHHGSCGYGYLWPDQNTGWDIAALADTHPEYSGSCGGCYEVECSDGNFRDGYGAALDRSGVCRGGSVVVRTTDTCPCQYANNYYSNKRWCCGDMPHFDISVWAFEKLADMKWGVIPIKYRRVDCSYQPANKASPGSFPGVFPPVAEGQKRKDDFDWYRYFPNGGYPSIHENGGSNLISTQDYLQRIGKSK